MKLGFKLGFRRQEPQKYPVVGLLHSMLNRVQMQNTNANNNFVRCNAWGARGSERSEGSVRNLLRKGDPEVQPAATVNINRIVLTVRNRHALANSVMLHCPAPFLIRPCMTEKADARKSYSHLCYDAGMHSPRLSASKRLLKLSPSTGPTTRGKPALQLLLLPLT